MADSDDISSRFFTLTEATAWLRRKSEKTLHRLIKSKKIRAEKRTVQGKKRLVIKGSELISYRLQKDGSFRRMFSSIPPIGGYGERLGVVFIFGTWGVEHEGWVQVSPRAFIIDERDQTPRFELEVSLDDLCRFVREPQSREQYETLKSELRSRLPQAPENFRVRFRLDNSTEQTLWRIVKSVKPPRLSGVTAQEVQQDAITHVLYRVLPDLWRANKKDWTHYAKRAVKNFYRDKARRDKGLFADTDALVDVDRLAETDSISDSWEYSIASRANARARKVKPADY